MNYIKTINYQVTESSKEKKQLIKYNFGIDAEWYPKRGSNLSRQQQQKLAELKKKYRKNHLISIAIEDWQTEKTHFYEHEDYGKAHTNKIWRGLPSLCELIDAKPLKDYSWEEKPDSIVIKLHFFFSPYDIKAFVCDEKIYRQICICSERKRILKTRFYGRKGVPVDRYGNFKTPWYVIKEGKIYQIKLNFIDYSGLAGEEGYKKTCAAYGIKLDSKNLMDEYKEKMNVAYDSPHIRADFIKYSCGDVKFKQLERAVLSANNYVRESILNLSKIKKNTMTKGAETAKLFFDFLKKKLKRFEDETIPYMFEYDRKGNLKKHQSNLQTLIKPSSVKQIVKNSNKELSTAFLSMVIGGRCKNENPQNSISHEPIVSMDLKSCYGLALKYAFFPLGKPVILEYPVKKPGTWITLAEMLKKYEKELVPGCWHATIDTGFETLSFNQSLFVSNSATKIELKIDFDNNSIVNINGKVGIYLNQIKNGILTHHSLQTARAVMNGKEWREFIRKVRIKAMAFHPKSLMVETVNELSEKHKNHRQGDLETQVSKDLKTTIIKDSRCRYWYKFNISEFIDPILSEREQLKEERNKYEPDSQEYLYLDSKQELLKLFVNSLYGALASQYFNISNSIVGNNITDKARSACFIMAKITNGYTSITDGAESPLMRFLVFNCLPSMSTLTNYQLGLVPRNRKSYIAEKPLGGYDWNNLKLSKNKDNDFQISFPDDRIFTTGKSNESWNFISIAYKEHIKEFFSKCNLVPDWVEEYNYEDKGIFKGIAVQSAANYLLERYEADRKREDVKIKARGNSLKKKYFSCLAGKYDEEIPAPMRRIMTDLYQYKEIKEYKKCQVEHILKVNEWNKQIKIDPEYPLLPGETISRNVMPFPIKASAFYYRTIAQRETLEKIQEVLETKSSLGLAALFANNGSYKYEEVCWQLQTDILQLNEKDFRAKYRHKVETFLGAIVPRLFY